MHTPLIVPPARDPQPVFRAIEWALMAISLFPPMAAAQAVYRLLG